MQIFLILLGLCILILTFIDFFYTTLSGNGFWGISRKVNGLLSKLVLNNKSPSSFKYSGMAHILVTSITWLILLLLGVFLIFSSGETMVVHSNTQEPASIVERIYYSCYTVSTLGIGDYVPGNDLSRILTGILSFSGFILLTTAMTYLLSVITAVQQKKQLAFYISSLGKNIESLYQFFTTDEQLSGLQTHVTELRKLLLQNASSSGYFPIVHHFLSWNRIYSVEVQVTSLYEVLHVLRNEVSPQSPSAGQVDSLLKAIEYYLDQGIQNKEKYEPDWAEIKNLRKLWGRKGLEYQKENEMDKAVHASLVSSGWSWEEVYKRDS